MLRGNLSSASGSNSRYLSGKGRLFISDYRTCLYADWVLGQKKKTEEQCILFKRRICAVALSWIILSLIGALPMYLTGEFPSYIDALFETISGFTTTGSSILSDVETLSRGTAFWRCFTHWIGGMGVLVFIMAVMPLSDSSSMHLMRAESPGPSVGKLVPR